MTLATKAMVCYIQAFLGEPDWSHDTAINYKTADTATGAVVQTLLVNVLAAATDYEVDLDVLFPVVDNCQFVAVQDVTNPTQAFSFATQPGGRKAIQAGAPICWLQNGGRPGKIYLSNANAGTSQILVTVISL